MTRPNLFIIGAPKTGTTSLYEYLRGHPDVFMSPIKEPIYFAPDIEAGFVHRFPFGSGEADYLALFDGARNERYRGEASTRYLASHEAPSLLHEFEPDARLIAMVRNPIDVMYALHNERVSHGAEDVTDFEAAIALDEDRRAGRHLPKNSNPLGSVYRDTVQFGAQLDGWLEVFARDRLHIMIFDDFARDTPAEFRGVLEFLGIDPTYRPAEFEVVNRSHRSRGGIVRALLGSRPVQSLRHSVVPRLIGEIRAAQLSRRLRHSRLNRQPNPRPPLKPEVRQRLGMEFRADVERLGALVQRDLATLWLGGD